MPRGTNQKFKLYRLAQIMLERTDDDHYITMPEIMSALGEYEITADRKSIYNDLRDLEILGIEVEGEPIGNRYHYHVVNRPFELPELKLLVDAIHNAISENKKIKFQYYQWNVKKEMELRHNGAWYHISPWGLSWDDENYYLVGYDSDAGKIKHYRVDKMLHILVDMSGEHILMLALKHCISNFCCNFISNIRIYDFAWFKGNDYIPDKIIFILHHIIFS